MSDDPWLKYRAQANPEEADLHQMIMDEVRVAEQAAEITRLRAVSDEVRGYLSRLLQSLHPAIDLLPNVLGVCTQIDHVLGGQREEITRLRAELATAKREGMEEAAKIVINLSISTPSVIAAAIRAAAGEVK